MDSFQDVVSAARAFKSTRNGAQTSQRFSCCRLLRSKLINRIIFDNAAARNIPGLCFSLAPCRNFHHDSQFDRLANPKFQALPGLIGVCAIRADRGKDLHFVLNPMGPVLFGEIGFQKLIDVPQVSDIGKRIIELFCCQRAAGPIGEAGGLVDPCAGHLVNELVVGNGIAKTADHGRNLGIKKRRRDHGAQMVDNLNILTRSMKHLCHIGVAHQVEKGSQIKSLGQCVDDKRHVRSCHLYDTEFGPEGRFTEKFRVDGDKVVGGKALAGSGKVFSFCNHFHGDRKLYPSSAVLSPRNGTDCLWGT